MHPCRVEIDPAFRIAEEGIVGETVPEAGDHIVELARTVIARIVLHLRVLTEIQRRIWIRGGDDVPPRPAAAEMVERGEAPGDVIGLVEGGRGGRHQPDPLRRARQGGQQREGLEGGDGVAALQRIHRHVQHGQMIRHEEGVELRLLQPAREMAQMREVEVRVRPGARIAPGTGVDGHGAHEGAQVQLSGH